ncbi:uncharacterized protein LOC125491265 [Plutella xylostella]|uniref:uncharacterized protein LOC125491265 n=1 Tax=Plutella xylostella TaxID=51655 RepID=UPI0020327EB2|nr:uncharacterized protein LOC125491265 [Plutella xylostella]
MSQSVAGPSHGGYRSSSHDYMRCPLCPQDCNARYHPKEKYKIIETKISDGDIKGATQLMFSNDSVAPDTPETLQGLQSKHPPQPPSAQLPDAPASDSAPLQVLGTDVYGAIMSFRCGSTGGLDGLSPQHLKDLLASTGQAGETLLSNLTALINLMLAGKVNTLIAPLMYGARICALNKKDGGIRPIAVGSTLRRIASKVCCRQILPKLSTYLQPLQLGFGSKGGCEAAVHALRTYIEHDGGEVVLKVDIKNAFNSIDRGTFLTEIKELTPEIYPYLWQCYSSPSNLIYNSNLIHSEVGCQQGDPLGPAIFSLAIHKTISSLKSKLNMWYLDDGTLGGESDTVLDDLRTLTDNMREIGLELNSSKREIFIPSHISETKHLCASSELPSMNSQLTTSYLKK